MARPYRPDRDRDFYRDRDNHRDRDRDRDRDFHRQQRRPSGFSDGPPPHDHRRSPHGGFSDGGPFYPPPPDHRRNHHGEFSPGGPPHPPPLDHGGNRLGGFPPHPHPPDHRRSPLRGLSSGGAPYPPPPDHGGITSGGLSVGGRTFDSSPRQPLGNYRSVPSDPAEEFRPMSGGGFGSDFPPQRPPLHHLPVNHHPSPPQLSGQKRGFPFPGRGGGSPENYDGRNYVKLFVGSVPSTATEEEIRPLFEERGKVLEVALIKDKRTGQQQGCCFIKYGTSEEADRAIRALHNQCTLPGGVGPVQVRYADGERERLGNVAVEYKLFVGSLNKYATEKEVEEIFVPYGRIDDVYLMRDERRQSKGCGFVKFSNKDSAMAAVNALNGMYTMRGCDQPLIVRFADPKRPRAGEPRAGSGFGGPGSGPSPSSGFRPAPGSNFPDTKGCQDLPNAGQSLGPRNMGPSPNAGIYGFGNQLTPRSGEAPISSIPGGYTSAQGDIREGSFTGSASASCTSSQDFNQSFPQVPLSGQQISPLPKPLRPPQHFPPALQQHQVPGSFFQAPTSQPSARPPSQLQSSTLAPYSQPFQSQQLQSLHGQLPPAEYQVQQSATSGTAQPRPNTSTSQTNSQLATPAPQHPLYEQSPSQLAQMLSQQTQTLQASFQSSQQTFSHLQQQVQMMQPPPQNQPLQQSFQATKQQSQWAGAVPTTAANAPHVGPTRDAPPPTSLAPFVAAVAAKAAPAKCDWTEHTSPSGHKYYYNSATGESRWNKPEELTLYEQQQTKSVVTQPQPLAQQNLQAIPTQQVTQSQPSQLQTQFRSADPLQHPPTFSIYPTPGGLGNQTAQEKTYSQSLLPPNSVTDPSTFQQGFPAAQDWAWNNSRGN